MSKVKSVLFYEKREFIELLNSFQFLEAAKILVLSERKSFMTMTYIVLIMIAYFGPNAQHLGNIQLEIWHFEKSIKDIYLYAKKVSLLLAVDFLSFIINGILLAYFSGINLLKVMKTLQQEFWIAFAITEGFLLMEVFDCICQNVKYF